MKVKVIVNNLKCFLIKTFGFKIREQEIKKI